MSPVRSGGAVARRQEAPPRAELPVRSPRSHGRGCAFSSPVRRRLELTMSTLFGDFSLPELSPAAASAEVDARGVPTWVEAGGDSPPEGAGRHDDPVNSRAPEALLEGLNPQQRAAVIHPVSYTHLRAHETVLDLVCRLLLE